MATPNNISHDVWEVMRPQIVHYYQEEEWPLKQVIKRLKTEEFNPSDSQLRSKLKKWKINKPSRKSHKKSAGKPSTCDSKVIIRLAQCDEDNTSPVQKSSAQLPLPIYDAQRTTPHLSLSTGIPSCSMPTTSNWERTSWTEDDFTVNGQNALHHGSAGFLSDPAELHAPIPNPAHNPQPFLSLQTNPMPSHWEPPQTAVGQKPAQCITEWSMMAQSSGQPLNSPYPAQAQNSPMPSQYFEQFPSEQSSWRREGFQNSGAPGPYRSASYASNSGGDSDKARVNRPLRMRQHDSPAGCKQSSTPSNTTQEYTSPDGSMPSPMTQQSSLMGQTPRSSLSSQPGQMSFEWAMNTAQGRGRPTHAEMTADAHHCPRPQPQVDDYRGHEIHPPFISPTLLNKNPPQPKLNSYQTCDLQSQPEMIPRHDLQPQQQPYDLYSRPLY